MHWVVSVVTSQAGCEQRARSVCVSSHLQCFFNGLFKLNDRVILLREASTWYAKWGQCCAATILSRTPKLCCERLFNKSAISV